MSTRMEFDAEQFRSVMEEEAKRVAGAAGMDRVKPAVVDALVKYLAANGPRRFAEEGRTVKRQPPELSPERRLIRSVGRLMTQASKLAAESGRRGILLSDVQQAYKDLHCQVWPLC